MIRTRRWTHFLTSSSQAELAASESERGRLADALAASARQVESAVNQLREAQAAADRSDERARRAEVAVEEVSGPDASSTYPRRTCQTHA